jgi:hypothetical protein
MILNSFFTQIVMLTLAVGMLFFYVRPTFGEIGKVQDSIIKYQEEQSRVNEVNAKLASLVSKLNAVSASDMKALLTYLPDQIDHVAISRDIYLMSEAAEMFLKDVEYSKAVMNTANSELSDIEQPLRHEFTVSGEGSYEQIKKFLELTEKNNYPLEVVGIQINSAETGLLSTEMTLATYSHLK